LAGTKHYVPRLVTSLIATVVVATFAASAGTGTGSTRRFAINDGTQVSANWSGYTLQGASGAGLQFTSVTGTWRVPATKCEGGETASAAVWVGLGGTSDAGTGLEQTGTAVDCSRGRPQYYAWYESLPAPSVDVPMAVKPGDLITTSVNVRGTRVLFQIKNRTRKTSFTRPLKVASPDVSSAEWIAEAPAECGSSSDRCRVLPLANFGSVTFTRAAAIANSHPGTISDSTWSNSAISLVPQSSGVFGSRQSSTAGAMPGALSADGRTFGVSWVANAAP
jgi:hypothetical protein